MPRAAKLEHLTLALLCDLEDAYATVQLAIARLGEPDRDTLGWDLERALVCLDALLERELGVELSPLSVELSPEVGDGSNREGGISWGCLTTSLLHRRSDMPCPTITLSA